MKHLLKQNKAFVVGNFQFQKLLSLAFEFYDGRPLNQATYLHIYHAI